MSVDSSRISLKGLYLDTLTNTVGGTRNIYNNGVMCGKVFLRFSYSPKDGEKTTVQEVINWLDGNGAIYSFEGSESDTPVYVSKHNWTSSNSTDPNSGKYVYDTRVVVPESTTNKSDIVDSKSVYSYGYFIRASSTATPIISVYYRTYGQDAKGIPTLSTWSSAAMKVSATKSTFSSSDFILNATCDNSESGVTVRDLCFVNSYNKAIHSLLNVYDFQPRASSYQNENNVPFAVCDYDTGIHFILAFCQTGAKNADRIIYILDRKNLIAPNQNFTASETFHQNNGLDESNLLGPCGVSNYTVKSSALSGIPIGTQDKAYYTTPNNHNKWDTLWVNNFVNNSGNTISLYTMDSCGNKIKIDIDLDAGKDWDYQWGITSAAVI